MPRGNVKNLTNAGKGRPPGVPNKEIDIKGLARSHGPAGIAKLAELAGFIEGVPPARKQETQVAAIRELLDRGYGRPSQAHSLEGDGELLGVVLIPAKRPVGSRDLAPAPLPQIEGRIEDAEVVSDGPGRPGGDVAVGEAE